VLAEPPPTNPRCPRNTVWVTSVYSVQYRSRLQPVSLRYLHLVSPTNNKRNNNNNNNNNKVDLALKEYTVWGFRLESCVRTEASVRLYWHRSQGSSSTNKGEYIDEMSNHLYFRGATAPNRPGPPPYRGFTLTFRHTTHGRTPLDEWSARRRDLYLDNTQHSQETDIHTPVGTRTHNPS
jgi:hypothetical protein